MALVPGSFVEMSDRIFKVERVYRTRDGVVSSFSAECLTPKDGDLGPHWSFKVNHPDQVRAHTPH